MQRGPDGCYRALGRTDDTMNLSGIKTSSAALERVLSGVEGVRETAAVTVPPPGGGPERRVVFAVPEGGRELTAAALEPEFQTRIRKRLNTLFKVWEVRVVAALPRTESNKVLRRVLRQQAMEG